MKKNEVRSFQDMKSFGAAESSWRLLEYPLSQRYPSVKRLPVHLKDQQTVRFEEEGSIFETLESGEITELTSFFKYNAENPGTNVTYINFPEMYVFVNKAWKIRQRGCRTIGRIYSVPPNKGDLFYLRILLCDNTVNFSAGKVSFEDMLTINGVQHNSYREVCLELGLMKDDEIWSMVLMDAKEQNLPKQMRMLFIILLIFTDIGNPAELFNRFWSDMAEDYKLKLDSVDINDPEILKGFLLRDLKENLETLGHLQTFDFIENLSEELLITLQKIEVKYQQQGECREVIEELEYNRDFMEANLNKALKGTAETKEGKLTTHQFEIFKEITNSLEHQTSHKLFFLDAPGGTGKTYLLNNILYFVRLYSFVSSIYRNSC